MGVLVSSFGFRGSTLNTDTPASAAPSLVEGLGFRPQASGLQDQVLGSRLRVESLRFRM